MKVRWTHITVGVSNIERSVEFFREFCGLEVLRDRRKEGGGTVWLGYETPESEFPTYILVISEQENILPLDHFGFQCDSREAVDKIAEIGRGRGILVNPPTDSGGVVGYWTMIREPSGHIVEFTFGQPLKGLG